MDERLEQLKRWLKNDLGIGYESIAPASSDASFRRYFRITQPQQSFIVMDAPPDKEDCGPFIKISAAMSSYGLNVPRVLQQDLAQGFLLLSDLGEQQYLGVLNDDTVDALYADAIAALVRLQARGEVVEGVLPAYDRGLLMREMGLFREWFLEQHLALKLSAAHEAALAGVLNWLCEEALAQPRVWVHRDYHSRNLMVTAADNPGVLDFQDAVFGPPTYDLVSLLKDCYIVWPRQRVEGWVADYQQQALAAGVEITQDRHQLLHQFDVMGVQRHLKVLGIFSRLNIRDGKPGYLDDLPRVMDYVVEVSQRMPELAPLQALLEELVFPVMPR